jgi:hypothetical protein
MPLLPLFNQNITYFAESHTSVAEFPGGIMNGFGIPVVVPPQEALPGIIKYPPVLFFKTMKPPVVVLGNVSVPGLTEVML